MLMQTQRKGLKLILCVNIYLAIDTMLNFDGDAKRTWSKHLIFS